MNQEELKAVLDYEPGTGVFTWLPVPGRRVRGGRKAGAKHGFGYVRIGFGRRGKTGMTYLAHRVAWLYMTGAWPVGDIDHINGVRSDNRWANLRCVSRALNLQNMRRARADSSTGFLGVQRNRKRFSAKIQIDRKQVYLGTFDTPQQAHEAYLAAKRLGHAGCTI